MGCFPSKDLQYQTSDGQQVAALQHQIQQLQQQLASGHNSYPAPTIYQQYPNLQQNTGGGLMEVLFFPDPALPCHYMGNCRRKNCTFSHQATSLTRLQQYLASARTSIDVCVFTITCDEITRVLLDARQRGVRIRVITDNDQANTQGSDIAQLRAAGIPVVTDRDQYHMHHKFAILDGRIVVNGSFNWTRQAVLYNQENLVICDNPTLAQQFMRQFELLWSRYASARR